MQSQDLSVLELLGSSIAKMGQIPEHIAVIMDGNRRYARTMGMKTLLGHQTGANVLHNLESWGKALGCKELTVYAFSTENFKRTKEEVENLMDLMFYELGKSLLNVEDGSNMDTCIQFIGNLHTLPAKVQHRMANIMKKTRYFEPYKLNIAVAYTGREGILRSMNVIQRNTDNNQINTCLVDQSQHLMDVRPVDMLIRTGGDLRLSDFMLWESSHAYIHFTPVTWPELTFWQLLHACFMYQIHRKKVTPKELPPNNYLDLTDVQYADLTLEKSRTLEWKVIDGKAGSDFPHGRNAKIPSPTIWYRQLLKNVLTI
ncbi:isoprenyl transferase [Folsomia candida]|uniref:Alkyl transferase n=1 Tax=Folsomia candida TaxID=158441 RepID=A0A226EVT4_FOLCA|nr:isoprenyl transferase [Folsomia candida]OXA61308.1 Dehydrodolichyl diphosphate syntase complex subunit DHDDS [Folsomia candida]